MLSLVSKSSILRCTESSLNLWVKMAVMTVLLETFLTSHSVNKVPCLVWHTISGATLNLRGRKLWKADIFSKTVCFSSHLREVWKLSPIHPACSSAFWPYVTKWLSCLRKKRLVLPLKELPPFCTDLCSCWGLWRGFIRQKVQQPLSFRGLYPSRPIYNAREARHSKQQLFRDHAALRLAGDEDRVSACDGADDRHLRRGRDELQRQTLLPSLTASYSPLKGIPPKHPRSLMRWLTGLITSNLGPQ